MAGYLIEIKGLKTAYGDKVVHRGVDMYVKRGEILSILGGSGSGKSTLLKVMLLLKEPEEGKVLFDGVDAFSLSSSERQRLRDRMGVLFQSGALFSSITVGENIVYCITRRRAVPYHIACEMAVTKLRMANLASDVFFLFPDELSGGMKKKAALARALALDPDILFLDEPTSGLDPISADEFDRTLRSLVDLMGITVVMITHDLSSLLISDRVAVLSQGRVIYQGSVDGLSLVDDYWVRRLLGGDRGRRFIGVSQA